MITATPCHVTTAVKTRHHLDAQRRKKPHIRHGGRYFEVYASGGGSDVWVADSLQSAFDFVRACWEQVKNSRLRT